MKLITIDMDALAKAIDCNTDATEQDARSIINAVLYKQAPAATEAPSDWRVWKQEPGRHATGAVNPGADTPKEHES